MKKVEVLSKIEQKLSKMFLNKYYFGLYILFGFLVCLFKDLNFENSENVCYGYWLLITLSYLIFILFLIVEMILLCLWKHDEKKKMDKEKLIEEESEKK